MRVGTRGDLQTIRLERGGSLISEQGCIEGLGRDVLRSDGREPQRHIIGPLGVEQRDASSQAQPREYGDHRLHPEGEHDAHHGAGLDPLSGPRGGSPHASDMQAIEGQGTPAAVVCLLAIIPSEGGSPGVEMPARNRRITCRLRAIVVSFDLV